MNGTVFYVVPSLLSFYSNTLNCRSRILSKCYTFLSRNRTPDFAFQSILNWSYKSYNPTRFNSNSIQNKYYSTDGNCSRILSTNSTFNSSHIHKFHPKLIQPINNNELHKDAFILQNILNTEFCDTLVSLAESRYWLLMKSFFMEMICGNKRFLE
mmetsp:Transcript_5971/g.10599  ORF Transcript_5971/g.10599 Transcript_5971/m.10599 type:complete len:155 (-) Transcript_5971:303-767(-)